MGVLAVGSDAGVEFHGVAALAGRLLRDPGQEPAGVPAATGRGHGGEVVDVQEAAPGEVVAQAEARDGTRLVDPGLEGGDDPVALRALEPVDAGDESVPVVVPRAGR